MMRFKGNETGQVALIVLLVMVVMLTLGIAVAQRGVTDVRIAQQEEDSARAFQAAEAGIEEALSTLVGGSGSFGEDTSYDVTVGQAGSSGFVFGQPVAAGEVVYVNLAGASPGMNRLDVYFMEIGKDDCDVTPAAVEVMILSSPGGNTRVRREGFDISSRGNNFDQVTKGNYSFEGVSFCAKATVNLTGNDQQVRIRPLYNRAVVGVDPQPANATLPNQYLQVESVGQTEAGVTRAVTVKRSEPQLPPIFDYALFSGGGIIKGQ